MRSLPDPLSEQQRIERDHQELALQLASGMAWIGSRGYGSEMEQAYSRARELCRDLDETPTLCFVLGRLAVRRYIQAEHQAARELADEALRLARGANDPLHVALGHRLLGTILFCLGEYPAAHKHLKRMIAFYDPRQHHRPLVRLRGSDAGTSALAYDACCLWCLGYPDQAISRSQKALTLARQLGHPFSLADAIRYAGGMLSQMRRDPNALQVHADELIRLTDEAVPGWLESGAFLRAQALAMLGQSDVGIAQMRATVRAIGRRYLPVRLGFLAEAQADAGDLDGALGTVDEALAVVEETGEHHWESELYRVRAELLRAQDNHMEAVASLRKAIEIARSRSARSWELRAATSLARLWHKRGRVREAREVLAPVYHWFTEGFDTRDLKEARELLSQLS
jgi:adenylate cyclase